MTRSFECAYARGRRGVFSDGLSHASGPGGSGGEICDRAKYRWQKTALLTVAAGVEKNFLFWTVAGENLELSAVTECILMHCGIGKNGIHHSATKDSGSSCYSGGGCC